MREMILVAVGVACVLLLAPWSLAGDDPVATAESAAEASAATREGEAFRADVGAAFGRDHGKSIRDCATELGRADASEFVLLVQFNGTGGMEQALAKPSTNLAVCLQRKLKGWRVRVPPTAGTWVKLRIRRK